MISIEKKFLFVHVPKTGGNSLQSILKDFSEDHIVALGALQDGVERFELRNERYDITKHSTLSEYKGVLDRDVYRTLFKFAVIRNPWDRMISFYFSPHRGVTEWCRDEFLNLLTNVYSVRYYICESPSFAEGGSADQPSSPTLDADIDFVLKFEELERDFRLTCERLGIPFSGMPKRNRSAHEHYSSYYDDELKEVVRQKFSEEISYGRYEFETV